jgi:hypothetical protein
MREISAGRILFVAVGASEAVRLSRWSAPLWLRKRAAAAPDVVAAFVRDVERETELVPGVRRVTVLERTSAENGRPTAVNAVRTVTAGVPPSAVSAGGWVRYRVEGMAYGLPWTVRFCKEWVGNTRFVWRAEGGTGRPEQFGELLLVPEGAGTQMELRVRTRSALPVLGGAATLLFNPLFLAPTFSAWLRNLARAAEAEGGRQPGTSPGSH